MSDTNYDELYADLKAFFTETKQNMDISTVISLTHHAMSLVQTKKQLLSLPGVQKKELVMNVLIALVKDLLDDPSVVGTNLTEETRQAILMSLDAVPYLIDAAVNFAKVYSTTLKKVPCFSFCFKQ